MMIPTGPPALLISGLAELSDEVTKDDKMAIAKMLAVRSSPPFFSSGYVLVVLTMVDYVCPLAVHLFYGYGCTQGYRGSTGVVKS